MDNEHRMKDYTMANILFRMLKLSKKYWFVGIIIIILIGVEIYFNIGIAYVNEQALNFIESNNESKFIHLLQIAFIIGSVCIFLLFIQEYLKKYIPFLVSRDLAFKLYKKIHKLPLLKFYSLHTGDLAARVRNDSQESVEIIGKSAFSLIFNLFMALFAFTYLSTISWPLALLIVCIGPVTILVGRLFDKKLRRLSTDQQNINGEIKSFLQEYLQGMTTVRAYGLNHLMKGKFLDKRHEFNSVSLKRSVTKQLMWIIIGLTNKLIFIAVFITLCFLAMKGNLEIGALIAFFILMNRVQAPFTALAGTLGDMQESFGAAKRVNHLLDMDDQLEKKSNIALKNRGDNKLLELKNVSFAFPSEQHKHMNQVISDISLTINEGDKIAIVGLNGAGKTTLAKIICGLYTPSSGDVILYQENQVYREASLSEYVSFVPQKTYVFSGTIYENISCAEIFATKEKVINASKSAQIHDEIIRLEKGYKTMIGEKGYTLSGGQLQRLTIARALLKQSPLFVLDEATSSLDVQNEKLVYEAMDRLMSKRTVVVIAHRLSTIKQMDKIIVLDRGEIVEEGKHEELMERQGNYYNLVQSQYENTNDR